MICSSARRGSEGARAAVQIYAAFVGMVVFDAVTLGRWRWNVSAWAIEGGTEC